MKIAVIYNRSSNDVINVFGVANREKYGLAAIKRITDALKKGRHQVLTLEGDKNLIHRLEEFMPQVIKGERPGIVFNLSYGIQGQARYTHVPGILEMLGIPYVGSGPLAHSLSLDKVVAKTIFKQHGLPTPEFAVLENSQFEIPEISYPMIVKPKNESTSFGLQVVNNERELRGAAEEIFKKFGQAVLVEEYIDGREINVGILGNKDPQVFAPAEVHFDEGPSIYTLEDKKRISGREIRFTCPAKLNGKTAQLIQDISKRAFEVLGCADCARIDLRLDPNENPYILEINSLPSLGEHGSYVMAAETGGLDFTTLINKLVEVASTRYFGTPHPPSPTSENGAKEEEAAFQFLTARRERLEKRLEEWVSLSSRTNDSIGIRRAYNCLDKKMGDLGLRNVAGAVNSHSTALYETKTGLEDGTLLIVQLDVPFSQDALAHGFKREPEWLYGEGIGASRGSLVMLEFALRTLKHRNLLKKWRGGILAYSDEGNDFHLSSDYIRNTSRRARRVLVLSPGSPSGKLIVGRRGLRKYRLSVEGEPRRLGQTYKKPETGAWIFSKLAKIVSLSDKKKRLAVAVSDIRQMAFPTLLPHRFDVTLNVGYGKREAAEEAEDQIRVILGKAGLKWDLERLTKRPAMVERAHNIRLANDLCKIASFWDINLEIDTSVHSSVSGLVAKDVPVVCGLGPHTTDIYTPQERIRRISLVQRTLILSQYLIQLAQQRA